jgi:hypothetical protein
MLSMCSATELHPSPVFVLVCFNLTSMDFERVVYGLQELYKFLNLNVKLFKNVVERLCSLQ